MQEGRISIDLDSIPESVRMQLVAAVYEAAKECIQQPGVREKFERWRERRKAKKPATWGAGIELLCGLHFVRYLSVKVVQR